MQVIPPPTFVKKGCFPADDDEAWQNNVVLIDKPLEWTSFGICGKLRGALDIKKVGLQLVYVLANTGEKMRPEQEQHE